MQLKAKELVEALTNQLLERRARLKRSPGLALIWVGNDKATEAFIRAKQQKAKLLNCNFFLHRFDTADEKQLTALIKGLNRRKDIDGIVLQLPLPSKALTAQLINLIDIEKDVDHLRPESNFLSPTPKGILDLLQFNQIEPDQRRTMILGAGRLVGGPLSIMFRRHGWDYDQIERQAGRHIKEIAQHNLIISATGVRHLIQPAMVNKETIVIDGSGVDVDVDSIEPLVAAVTPKRGAIGPLTVCNLFDNLLTAVERGIQD